MNNKQFLRENVTVLVNSCDAYCDLWEPFFLLWRKYAAALDIKILLNTESQEYRIDGLDIECVRSPDERWYGQRMLNALSHVKTKYVILMLDDFFLRNQVKADQIGKIVQWMEEDPDIAYFICDYGMGDSQNETENYPGYVRIPFGSEYTLSMQAAIWRTDILKQFWRPQCSPWEWEIICNALIYQYPQYKYYSLKNKDSLFFDYGHYMRGDIWGVFRGKWILEDVEPLFEKEGIRVDLSTRGGYNPDNEKAVLESAPNRLFECRRIKRCLGRKHFLPALIVTMIRDFCYWRDLPVKYDDYGAFLKSKAKRKFLR